MTPRWIGIANFANSTNKNRITSGFVLVIDSLKEVQIGLGRDFTKTILQSREAFITKSALKFLGVEDNGSGKVQLIIDLNRYFTNENLKKY